MGGHTQGYMTRESQPAVKTGRDAIAHFTDGAAMPIYWAANPKAAILKGLGLAGGIVLLAGGVVLVTTLVYGQGNQAAKGLMTGMFEAPGQGIRAFFSGQQEQAPKPAATIADQEAAAFNGRSLTDPEAQQ